MYRKPALLAIFALVVLGCPVSFTQDQPKPTVSADPLPVEQLAVYHAVVSQWMGKDKRKVNLANQTDSAGGMNAEESKDCEKGLDLEPPSSTVHRIRPQDLDSILPAGLNLIDPDAGSEEIRKNDPENFIRDPNAVDKAVENGFAHGMLSLGEIRFDKGHNHAMVSFSFVCGRLCGHGDTLILMKTAKGWIPGSDCDNWISRFSPTPEPNSLGKSA